jgi:hypothetical protein
LRKYCVIFTILFSLFFGLFLQTMPADASRGGGKASKAEADAARRLAQEEAKRAEMAEELLVVVNSLTKKIYTNELFTPQDGEDLIRVKLTLDSFMDASPSPVFAPLFFRLATIFRLRQMTAEAIDCYQTILENFSATSYAPRARQDLRALGVTVQEPEISLENGF